MSLLLRTPSLDAWCDDCELIRSAHGGWNDEAQKLVKISKGIWKVTGSMNVSRAVTAATLLPNGQVLISGGNSTSAGGRSADLYSNGAWSLITSMSVLRRSLTATLLSNGDVLVFGGSNLESTKLSASEGQASINDAGGESDPGGRVAE